MRHRLQHFEGARVVIQLAQNILELHRLIVEAGSPHDETA